MFMSLFNVQCSCLCLVRLLFVASQLKGWVCWVWQWSTRRTWVPWLLAFFMFLSLLFLHLKLKASKLCSRYISSDGLLFPCGWGCAMFNWTTIYFRSREIFRENHATLSVSAKIIKMFAKASHFLSCRAHFILPYRYFVKILCNQNIFTKFSL